VSTTGWQSGTYAITVASAGVSGPVTCPPASTTSTLVVTAPGQFAFGSGWYTPDTALGTTSFGFELAQVPQTTNTDEGQLDVVTPGRWLFEADVTSYGQSSATQDLLSGNGALYWWNGALNDTQGGWQQASASVPYTATASASSETTAGSFGITITFTPVAPQPTLLPNSAPVTITRGSIVLG
jgi:hypothetical protein